YDLRTASATAQVVEGAAAPTAQARVRGNVINVTEIHQEAIEISYSKLTYTGQFASTGSSHTGALGIAGTNPVTDEMAWQTTQMIKQIARDVEQSFINGTFNNPSTNASARRTGGLLEAITTNIVAANNAPLTEDMVLDLMQAIWEAGGIMEAETRTLMCNAG